jgi:hypothetical protein
MEKHLAKKYCVQNQKAIFFASKVAIYFYSDMLTVLVVVARS